MDLMSAVTDLYGLEPGRFTAARDATVKEARAAGDRALADQIKQLRRPSATAWVLNKMVRDCPSDIAALVELGQQLRDAQEHLAGDQLRSLGASRRQLITALGVQARELAAHFEHPINDATQREVEAALDAALADPLASAALSSGLLVRSLENVGGAVDLTGATAIHLPAEPPAAPSPRQSASRVDKLKKARADAAAAMGELDVAQRALDLATSAATAARRRVQEADSAVMRLERDLKEARAELAEAEGHRRSLEQRCQRASRAVEVAASRAEQSRAKVNQLQN